MKKEKLESLSPEKWLSIYRRQRNIIRIQLGIIIAALIVVVILPLTIKLLKRSKLEPRLTPVSRTIANPTIEDYRKSFAYQRLSLSMAEKVKCIVHDFSDLKAYNKFFEKFDTTHATIGKGYVWKVGFYPAVYEVNGSPRLGMYVIPTMVNSLTGKVEDYFIHKDASYYKMKIDGSPENDDYIYDQGTIFP